AVDDRGLREVAGVEARVDDVALLELRAAQVALGERHLAEIAVDETRVLEADVAEQRPAQVDVAQQRPVDLRAFDAQPAQVEPGGAALLHCRQLVAARSRLEKGDGGRRRLGRPARAQVRYPVFHAPPWGDSTSRSCWRCCRG